MNWKRKKCRRVVRCTLCTDNRWKGNGKDRFKAKVMDAKRRDIREIREAAP